MLNKQLLEESIKESGLRKSFIIKKLGLSTTGFDKKQKGITPFRTAEIYVLCDLLNISEEDRQQIFFADEVASNTN